MNFFVDLIQLGFHGFAFALFYLSYKRFGDISAAKLPEGIPVDEIKARNEKTKMLLGTLRWFMAFSLIFFVSGVGAQIYTYGGKNNISLVITPVEDIPKKELSPVVRKKGKKQEPSSDRDDGGYEISVANEDKLTVSIEGILNHLEYLELSRNMTSEGFQRIASGELGE